MREEEEAGGGTNVVSLGPFCQALSGRADASRIESCGRTQARGMNEPWTT